MDLPSFPSRFAVFRGSPADSASFEWINSVMIFDSTECEDEDNGNYYAATMRPWVLGSSLLDENPVTPDSTIYDVKIHVPSQSSFADKRHYMRMPYSITKYIGINTGIVEFTIPVLAFLSTDWLPRATTIPHPFRRMLNHGEASLIHMRQMLFLAIERMRLHPNITRFLEMRTNLYDLIHYPSRDEPERTDGQHIAFWHDRLFRMSGREPLMSSLPQTEQQELESIRRNLNGGFGYDPPLRVAPSGVEPLDAVAATAASAASIPFEPLGWNAQPSDWPVFVYQNHLRTEMSKGTECPITLTKLADMTEFAVNPKCGHIFEPVAFTRWLQESSQRGEPMVCPLCRTDVPNGAMFIRFGTD